MRIGKQYFGKTKKKDKKPQQNKQTTNKTSVNINEIQRQNSALSLNIEAHWTLRKRKQTTKIARKMVLVPKDVNLDD